MDYAVPNNFANEAHGIVYNSSKPIGGIYYSGNLPARSVIVDKVSKKVQVKIANGETASLEGLKQEQAAKEAEAMKLAQEAESAKLAQELAAQQTVLANSQIAEKPEAKLVIERYSSAAEKEIAEQQAKKEAEEIASAKRAAELIAAQVESEAAKPVSEVVSTIATLLESNTNISQEMAQSSEEKFDAHKEALIAYEESLKELGITVNRKLPKAKRKGIYYSKPGAYVVEVNGVPVDFSAEGIQKPSLTNDDQMWLLKAQKYFLEARDERDRKIGSAEVYTSIEMLEALWATALQVGVEPKRFLVQIYNESRFNPHARGDAGERGIGQFMRNTARMLDLDWERMSAGEEGFAYQAKCAAEFVKSVGESKYNGGNPEYVRAISSRLSAISRTRVADYSCGSEACV